MIQKRAGWLTALFLGEMLTATAMGFFEAEIEKAVVLALFVPLIISSGGNSGSQAATLVIRALALGEFGLRDWWRVMRREILAGLSLGAILGSIGFLRIALWSAFSDIYGEHWPLVAVTVAISLVGVVLWGTLTGSVLPFVMRRLGFDQRRLVEPAIRQPGTGTQYARASSPPPPKPAPEMLHLCTSFLSSPGLAASNLARGADGIS